MAPQNDPFSFKYFKFLRSIENYRVRKIIKIKKMRHFLKTNDRPSLSHSRPDGPKKKKKEKTCWMRARTSFVCLLPVVPNERACRPSVRLVGKHLAPPSKLLIRLRPLAGWLANATSSATATTTTPDHFAGLKWTNFFSFFFFAGRPIFC